MNDFRYLFSLIFSILLIVLIATNVTAAPFDAFAIGRIPELLISNPFADPGGLTLFCATAQLYRLPEFVRVISRLGYTGDGWTAEVELGTFGWDLYRESFLKLGATVRISPQLYITTGLHGCHVAIAGEQKQRALALDAGCTLLPHTRLILRTRLLNFNEPKTGKQSLSALPMRIRTELLWRLSTSLLLQLRGESGNREGVFWTLGGCAELGPLRVVLQGSIVPATLSLYAAIRIGNTSTAVGFSAVRGAGEQMRTVAVRVELPGKQKAALKPTNRININSAGRLTLAALPEMTPARVEAVIAYRKLYGPFRRSVDICRVRMISRKLYLKIRGRIAIDSLGRSVLPVIEKPKTAFRINSAEMRDCIQAGFTAGEARRLVLFRDRLGGLQSIRELRLLPGEKKKIIRKMEQLYEH